jgi:hypothetical protein
MTSSFLVAPRPDMPPADGLQPVTAELIPSFGPKRLLVMISVIGVFELLMGLMASPVWFTLAVLTIVFGLYQFLGARRRYAAVGQGWLYLRTEPFGSGKWARFSDIQTIKVRSGGSLMPLLLLTTKQRRVRFTFDLRHPDLRTPVRQALAQEALASTASISPDASKYLHKWLT